jgi:D-mannonate dehydratase
MGFRLHSHAKHEIKYSEHSVFNWANNRINPIIECLAEGDFWADSDYIGGAHNLEASRENLLKNVEKIILPDPDWEEQETLNELIEEMENDTDIDRQYLYEKLKALIEEADPRNTYVFFSWF